MPWNDQSDGGDKNGPRGNGGGQGPWGSGPRQPWGGRPQGPSGGPQGGDLEDMLRRFRERMRGSFGGRGGDGEGSGGGGRGPSLNWPTIVGILFIGWLSLGVYVVDEGERGVITRFGALERENGPGLHLHLPPPIEAHQVEEFTSQREISVGYRERGNVQDDVPSESSMITGDRNIVDVDFRVLYRLSDVSAYLFNVRDPDDTVRGVAESMMREVIGQRELDAILTTDRASIEQAVAESMQGVLDSYDAGIQVQQVNLLPVTAPSAVIGAFNEVITAGQEKEAMINRADQFRNERVPRAQGEAAQIIQQAEAYREQVVREAAGEAERFNLVYDAYRANPRVTRERIYIETMERIYRDAETVIVEPRSGAVPYLPLDRLRSSSSGAAPAASNAAPSASAGGR